MKTSIYSRTFQLAKMAAKMGLNEVRNGSLSGRLQQAKTLVETLGQMKGAAMKAGQLLSLDLMDYFPKEAIEILSQLQSSASPEDWIKIEKTLRMELGEQKFSELQRIDHSPIGSASIGQVHRALYRDRPIVLKVQHECVSESIESDLVLLKTVASTFCVLSGRQIDLDPLFEEFKSILYQEVDYKREAEFQTQYGTHVAELNRDGQFRYKVPPIYEEISTKRVLAMDWMSGESLRVWAAKRQPKQKREEVATSILNLYLLEFFEWGLVQTDPNQGNFLVEDVDGAVTLVLLDFGATRAYTRTFINRYVDLLQCADSGDKRKLRAAAIDFGLIDARESDEAFDALINVIQIAVRPFEINPSKMQNAFFDFSNVDHLRNSQDASRNLIRSLRYSPPPRDLIFLHRKLAGVYAMLKSLDVKLNLTPYWERMISHSSAAAAASK